MSSINIAISPSKERKRWGRALAFVGGGGGEGSRAIKSSSATKGKS